MRGPGTEGRSPELALWTCEVTENMQTPLQGQRSSHSWLDQRGAVTPFGVTQQLERRPKLEAKVMSVAFVLFVGCLHFSWVSTVCVPGQIRGQGCDSMRKGLPSLPPTASLPSGK